MNNNIHGAKNMLQQEEIYIKSNEAARFLGISRDALYKLTMNRKISFYKPGGKVMLFLISDLDSYIKQNHFPSKGIIENEYMKSLANNKLLKTSNHTNA